MAPEDPIVHAMLLCDHVFYDEASGRHTLLGIFDAIRHPGHPAELKTAVVFLSLTNMRGAYTIDLTTGGLPLPVPGRYILRLRVNRRHLHDSAIMVDGDTDEAT